MLDSALATIKGGVYAVGVDITGYLVAHNAQFSQALTGDPQKDLVGNRTHRIFDTSTEPRAAKNTTPLLLQTDLRDTGELMCDIAMPIYLGGVHWGRYGLVAGPTSCWRGYGHLLCPAGIHLCPQVQ